MSFLKHRDRQPELMDGLDLPEFERRAALTGLKRINSFGQSVQKLWKALRALAPANAKHAPLCVLDLACGGGDIAIRLARRARWENIPLTVDGCDLSPDAVKFAQEASQNAELPEMKFFTLDVVNSPLPSDYDVIICTLFLHHLDEDDVVKLLTAMSAAARKAVLIADLLRTPLGYAVCWAGCHIISRSRIVHSDGPLSVRAAFTRDEIQSLVNRSGLRGAKIERHRVERFLIRWERASSLPAALATRSPSEAHSSSHEISPAALTHVR